VKTRLYTLCWQNGLCHWVLFSAPGYVICCSEKGYLSEGEALDNLQMFL
jgi:hypothetical protein